MKNNEFRIWNTFDPSAICVQCNVLHDRHHFPVTGILLICKVTIISYTVEFVIELRLGLKGTTFNGT